MTRGYLHANPAQVNERLLLALSVAAGSALGGVARWSLGTWIQVRAGLTFPWGTFTVNASGALLVGFLARVAFSMPTMSPELRLFMITGLCGGYTTFSAYSLETAIMLENGEYGRAAAYALGSVVVSLMAVFAGFNLARLVRATP